MLIPTYRTQWIMKEVPENYFTTAYWVNDAQQVDGGAVNADDHKSRYNTPCRATLKAQKGFMRDVE